MGQKVVGLDNFSTGHQYNLDEVRKTVGPEKWANFVFHEGDIRDIDTCHKALAGIDHVLHPAALGSVPRSLQDHITTHSVNINGFLKMFVAPRDYPGTSFVRAE